MTRISHLARVGCLAFGLALFSGAFSHLASALAPSANPGIVAAAHAEDVLVSEQGFIRLTANAPPAPTVFGPYTRYGFTVSPTYLFPDPFQRLQADYRALIPDGSAVSFDVRASSDGVRWTSWETDVAPGAIVEFPTAARYAQYRVTLLAGAPLPAIAAELPAKNQEPRTTCAYPVLCSLFPVLTLSNTERHLASARDAGVQVSSVALHPLRAPANVAYAAEQQIAPTYRIRATRQGMVGHKTANGHRITKRDHYVSLPSKRSLSNRNNPEYWVRITYNGRQSVVPVMDIGPWNIHDNYWDEKRERFGDLPRGYPQDHAAYFDGYNNGIAEKGRVSFPTAMDVGDGAWLDDLGIRGDQAWVEVTFLWLGADPQGEGQPVAAAPPPPPAEAAPPPPPANEFVVGTRDGAFQAHAAKEWYDKSGKCSASGRALWTYTTPDATESENFAVWKPGLPDEAEYDVYAYVPKCSAKADNTGSAHYRIQHRDGVQEVDIDQRATRGQWVHLGRFPFAAGDGGFVELHDITKDAMQAIWFDAVKWVKVNP